MEKNFFASVASHNLERFHSECLAWFFNTYPGYGKNLTRLFTNDKNARFIKAFTEVEQLDLVLYYQTGQTDKAVIIENKVKAAEGRKTLLRKEYESWNKQYKLKVVFPEPLQDLYKLSQTEYYYVRPKAKKEFSQSQGRLSSYKEITIVDEVKKKKKKKEETINICKKDCTFIYLIPARIFPEFVSEHLQFPVPGYDPQICNNWNFLRNNGYENPWITKTYRELLNGSV